jgi:hypothetical protein
MVSPDVEILDPKTGLSQSALTVEALKMTGQIINGITSCTIHSLDEIQKQRRQIVKTAFLLVETVIEEAKARQDVAEEWTDEERKVFEYQRRNVVKLPHEF